MERLRIRMRGAKMSTINNLENSSSVVAVNEEWMDEQCKKNEGMKCPHRIFD